MNSTRIIAIGHLIRDIIYIKNEGDGHTYLAVSRGGGSLWNTLANAAVNGSMTIALCVGGSDESGELCLEDLRLAGVTIAGKQLVYGKTTRTIHEMLAYKGTKPRHECSSACPVCSSKTYDNGTAKLSSRLVTDFAPKLKKISAQDSIIHIDNFNKTRFSLIKTLRNPSVLVSLDLGRLISFWKMSKEDILDNLKYIDILFINSILLLKLQQKVGFFSEGEFLKHTGIKLLISLQGENGIMAWVNSGEEILSVKQHASEAIYLVDTAGAGDAFIGFFLSRIAIRSVRDFENWLRNKSDIEHDLRKSQEWAAEKCMYLGARGHLNDINHSKWDRDFIKAKSMSMKSIEDLRLENEGLAKCCACNTPFLERSPLDRSRISINVLRFHGNVLSLPKSIERSWSHRNETPWRELLELSGPGYVIGTGGSFVVASFIAQLISKNKKSIVLPIKPFDFIRMGFYVPFAILISNSGKTPDILSALKRAQNIGIPKLLLISGNKRLESMDILRKNTDILLYTGANEDRGFLSVLGVIIPCFLSWAVSDEIWSKDEGYRYFNDLYLKSEIKVNNNFYKYKRNKDFKISGRKSIILGGGFAWPAMLNIESKMVESNFGRPQISEIKDYSHGRFVSSMDQNVLAIICGMPDDKEFREFLVDRIKDRNDVIEITSEDDGPIGSLELLLQSEHLMRCFTEKENIDISKPKIPRKGLELYKYKNILK